MNIFDMLCWLCIHFVVVIAIILELCYKYLYSVHGRKALMSVYYAQNTSIYTPDTIKRESFHFISQSFNFWVYIVMSKYCVQSVVEGSIMYINHSQFQTYFKYLYETTWFSIPVFSIYTMYMRICPCIVCYMVDRKYKGKLMAKMPLSIYCQRCRLHTNKSNIIIRSLCVIYTQYTDLYTIYIHLYTIYTFYYVQSLTQVYGKLINFVYFSSTRKYVDRIVSII